MSYTQFNVFYWGENENGIFELTMHSFVTHEAMLAFVEDVITSDDARLERIEAVY